MAANPFGAREADRHQVGRIGMRRATIFARRISQGMRWLRDSFNVFRGAITLRFVDVDTGSADLLADTAE